MCGCVCIYVYIYIYFTKFSSDFFNLNFISFIYLYSRFLLVIYFIRISVYMSIPISQIMQQTFLPIQPVLFIKQL